MVGEDKTMQLTIRPYDVMASSITSPISLPMGAESHTTGDTSEIALFNRLGG